MDEQYTNDYRLDSYKEGDVVKIKPISFLTFPHYKKYKEYTFVISERKQNIATINRIDGDIDNLQISISVDSLVKL